MPLDGTLYQDPILRILRAAQERIRDPENWCQHIRVGPNERVCAAGAIQVATGTLDAVDVWTQEGHEAVDLLDRAAQELGSKFAVELNDSTDHPTVMAMFDRAQELRLAEISELVA